MIQLAVNFGVAKAAKRKGIVAGAVIDDIFNALASGADGFQRNGHWGDCGFASAEMQFAEWAPPTGFAITMYSQETRGPSPPYMQHRAPMASRSAHELPPALFA